MGRPDGFMKYSRKTSLALDPEDRIKNYQEFHIPLSTEQQRRQGARCMECGVPFCHSGVVVGGKASGCPLNNLIPEWNDLLYTQNIDQALYRLLKTNNFPEFTARVCPAPCEAACTCGLYDDPVTIKENEWAIIEDAYRENRIKAKPPKVRTGKKIAVVGSGPAGLAAADQLNKRGHQVTVFEREDRIGGLLMYGIPNMKLEKAVIARKVQLMEQEGVEFVTNADVGKGYSVKKITEKFDAIVLACGSGKARDVQVPGRTGQGIYLAVDYLKSVTKSLLDSGLKDGKAISAKGKSVLVIGGGDTGNDCVGTAVRQGAAAVVQLEMMKKLPDQRAADNPWPQWPLVSKTDYGQEESIAMFGQDPRQYETTVKEFLLDEKGAVRGAITVKVAWQQEPGSGRLSMQEVAGSEQTVECQLVLIAAGFLGSEDYVSKAFGVERDQRANIATGQVGNPYETSAAGVFAAGDVRRGQSLVVWAIREGREAARAVDLSLMGYTNL